MKLRNIVVSALLAVAMVVPIASSAAAAPQQEASNTSETVTTQDGNQDKKKESEQQSGQDKKSASDKAESAEQLESDGSDTAVQKQAEASESSKPSDKQDTSTGPALRNAPQPRAAQAQPVVEANLLDGNSAVKAELTNPTGTFKTNIDTAYTLRVHAVFPSASEKKINVHLNYGVQYRNYNYDTTAGWYLALKEKGLVLPKDQADDKDKRSKVYGATFEDGTTSFNFQDGTQEVTFDIPLRVSWGIDSEGRNYVDGMSNIPEAISVTQSYVPSSGNAVSTKLATNLQVGGQRSAAVGLRSNIKPMQNSRQNIALAVDSPIGTGKDVIYNAGVRSNGPAVLDDYFVAMLAPAAAEYLGFGDEPQAFKGDSATPRVLNSGEHFTMSTGADYVVPAGQKLYVWQRQKAYTVTEFDRAFNPMWRFPKKDFPIGTVVKIQQIDMGAKFYNPYEESEYLKYNPQNLATVSYEIVEPQEDVYVNTTMYNDRNAKDWPLWEGYISDHFVHMGAPGFEHTQQRTFGYFTVGNRGTGDSRAKTIIIDYDMNNTHVGGVTAQALPFLSRTYLGLEPTKVTDFKVVLWDSNTNTTKEHTLENPPQRFSVQTVLGAGEHKGIFLKHIEYKIDTIPAKTKWISYQNDQYSGKESSGIQDTFPFYGVVLNNTKIEKGQWGDNPKLFKTRIRIENTGAEEPNWHHRNQDQWDINGDGVNENLKYEGRSADHVTLGDTFTGFTGTSFIQGHGSQRGWHDASIETLLGNQIRDRRFDYFTPSGEEGIETVKAIYVVSPYGSDMSFTMRYRSVGTKFAWLNDGRHGSNYYDAKQPEIYTVPVSDALKAQYPKAKLYKLDFSKLTDPLDKHATRAWGASVPWYEISKDIPYSINRSYWAYTGEPVLSISYTSDPAKDEVGTASQLMWYEFDTDTKETLEYGNGFTADKWDLNGNGSTDDLLGIPYGVLNLKSPTDIVANSAAKMATQPDTRYVTYDGVNKSVVGAESTVDYRLISTNPTYVDVNGFQLYWPVPKKDANWGKRLQPEGPFKFNMYLNGSIRSQLPAGYKVYYAKDAQPVADELQWSNFEWTEDKDTKNWKGADWDAVTFVKIVSPEGSVFKPQESMEFKFNLAVRDGENRNEVNGLLNVFNSAYLRDLGSGKTWAYGQPVGIVIASGHIGGTVWFDKDNDGMIDDEKAEPRIGEARVELYDARGELLDTVLTNKKGQYSFEGLAKAVVNPSAGADRAADAAQGSAADLPTYSVKVFNPDTNKYTQFSVSKDDNDMRFTADKSESGAVNVSASLASVNTESPFATAMNAGLTAPTSVTVKKVWADDDAQKQPIQVKVLADGSDSARNLDGKAVGKITLDESNNWTGEFSNLVINNAETNKPIEYSVEEDTPQGFVSAVTGDKAAGFTVTNTRIRGTVTVKKVDADDQKPLAGAKFALKQGDQTVAEGVSADDGVVTFKNVVFGDYEIVEIEAPTGYVLNKKVLKVSVTENGKTVDAGVVENYRIRGNVVVRKVDGEDQKPLAGARFAVKQGDKTVMEAVTTDEGVAVFENVEFGTYTLSEIEAPTGYVLNSEPREVVIRENGVTVDAGVVENSKIRGSMIAVKKDSKTGVALAGAEFEIRNTHGDVVRTLISNEKGELHAEDLLFGEYELVETKAPKGYELDFTPRSFAIIENGEEVSVGDITNQAIPSKPVKGAHDSKRLATTGSTVGGLAVLTVVLAGIGVSLARTSHRRL